jgi:hypothetical protein
MTVKVELLGGRGDELWPPPGRVFVVGPGHTFDQLGRAIDAAFARWDMGHLRMFTLADGTVVSDAETLEELEDSAEDEAVRGVELDARVTEVVGPGTEFRYVFDFGDNWTHCCTVEEVGIRPAELLGVTPREPTA